MTVNRALFTCAVGATIACIHNRQGPNDDVIYLGLLVFIALLGVGIHAAILLYHLGK